MKRLWENLPERLSSGIPGGKLLFMFIFSLFLVVANLPFVADVDVSAATGTQAVSDGLLAVCYLSLCALSWFVLVPLLHRRIRSDQRWLGPAEGVAVQGWLRAHRFLLPAARYGSVLAIGLFAGLMVSDLWTNLDPSFGASVQAHSLRTGWAEGFVLSLLAATEEVWRWSMIVLVVWGCRALVRERWARQPGWRWSAFACAVVVSSLLFGLGHVGEYPQHGLTTWLALSTSGLVLAACTFVTRRLAAGIAVHFVYDWIAFTNVVEHATDSAILWMAGASVCILLAWLLCLRRVWGLLRIGVEAGPSCQPAPGQLGAPRSPGRGERMAPTAGRQPATVKEGSG
ncbi:MAG: CPBP family intramembrane metalloprotease [Alicyclobacillaceae bacterium]|nr:CPBP family intramembrane metalloprotease [Alicyclobacillaceae bacterium]